MRHIIWGIAGLLSAFTLNAQQAKTEWNNPSTGSVGKAIPRTEFISYNIREEAEKEILSTSPFYRNLTDKLESPPTPKDSPRKIYITLVSIPFPWLDRELFLHVEGVPAFYLYVNDKMVGYAQGSHAPAEFNLSSFVTDGVNTIRLEAIADGTGAQMESGISSEDDTPRTSFRNVYLYSQPKLRIEDFELFPGLDSTGRNGMFSVKLAVANSYNSQETITVGYDIYAPTGKLLYYDMRDVKLPGKGRDTVRFDEYVYGVIPHLWSTADPDLYRVMLFVRRDGRLIEYIPYTLGFGETELHEGKLYRNGQPIDLSVARYNAADNRPQTRDELITLRQQAINTLLPDYPQPEWFYDLCDSIGLYVIDQADINPLPTSEGSTSTGIAPSNDPAWLPSFLDRLRAMQARNKNRTCIIGWSLGTTAENGYNMYKCYQWLKKADPRRAVIFSNAQGEWNSDLELGEIHSAEAILKAVELQRKTAQSSSRR